ncbi:MAG: glycosyl transferase, partial [Thaumarchaeota archaeon S14]
ETRFLGTRAADALGAPLGGLAITMGLLAGILGARSRRAVSWRGRSYELARMARGGTGLPT